MNLWNIPQTHREIPKDYNMPPVGLGHTKMSLNTKNLVNMHKPI